MLQRYVAFRADTAYEHLRARRAILEQVWAADIAHGAVQHGPCFMHLQFVLAPEPLHARLSVLKLQRTEEVFLLGVDPGILMCHQR